MGVNQRGGNYHLGNGHQVISAPMRPGGNTVSAVNAFNRQQTSATQQQRILTQSPTTRGSNYSSHNTNRLPLQNVNSNNQLDKKPFNPFKKLQQALKW